jgi:HTH-type transcriptional regulator / antitoxin HigA
MTGKMTLTFNPESYTDLLIRYQPKPIATDADYEAAIALASNIEHRSLLNPMPFQPSQQILHPRKI